MSTKLSTVCIEPVHIALVGLAKELYGGQPAGRLAIGNSLAEIEVRPLKVVPSQPAQQFEVEVGELVENSSWRCWRESPRGR